MSALIRNIGKYREKPKDIIDGMHILKRTANRFPLFYERIQKISDTSVLRVLHKPFVFYIL